MIFDFLSLDRQTHSFKFMRVFIGSLGVDGSIVGLMVRGLFWLKKRTIDGDGRLKAMLGGSVRVIEALGLRAVCSIS